MRYATLSSLQSDDSFTLGGVGMSRSDFISLALVLTLAGTPISAAALNTCPSEEVPATQERLDLPTMEQLVRGPLAQVRRGHLEAGKQEFERDIEALEARNGERLRGDMLESFGVTLYVEGHHTEAAIYLRRAAAAYREALGPESPDVALALNSLADVLYADVRHEEDDPPPSEVLAIFEEVLRIRLKSLGTYNAETAVTHVHLGRLKGHPALTRGDPLRVDEAAELARHGLDILNTCPDSRSGTLIRARQAVAEVYARNGRSSALLAFLSEFLAGDEAFGAEDIADVATMLEETGDLAGAAEVRRRYGLPVTGP